MGSTNNSGQGHGTKGSPQETLSAQIYPQQVSINELSSRTDRAPVYVPSPKHEAGHNWGSENPIKSQKEGQHLLDTGYRDGKQVYNITNTGKMVKFQPDGSPNNGYHSYEVFGPPDIPPLILKRMAEEKRISKSDYRKYLRGKKK